MQCIAHEQALDETITFVLVSSLEPIYSRHKSIVFSDKSISPSMTGKMLFVAPREPCEKVTNTHRLLV
jgi:hypothetical protein